MNKMALRFAGLGSFVERSATKAAIAQTSLSAARRDARSDVAHIAPEVAAAYTLRMTRTRVGVFRCDQNIMRAMRRGRAGARGGLWRHKCLGLRMPLAVLRAGTRYEVRGPMTAVLWASGVVQGAGLAKTLRGPLQRTCGPRTARGAALESLAAPLAPKKCVSAPKLSEPAPRRSPN